MTVPLAEELMTHDWRMQRFFFLLTAKMSEAQITVQELARKTGVRMSTLQDLLMHSEVPSFMSFTAICDVLGINTREIFEWEWTS